MKIVLASANKGKIKEIQALLPHMEVIPFSDIVGHKDIIEDGDSFKANAVIKAKAVVNMLNENGFNQECIVISDDSGITVPALNNEPNIYSARYAGEGATDKQNLDKLISRLKEENIKRTKAFYTACMAIGFKGEVYTVHGWMHGDVIDETKGDGGFGYDPMFIPEGFSQTLGELEYDVKKEMSHRTKALNLALKVIGSICK